ncbi:DUF58 domain-containing protein [Paenibacillus alba]|uniref:DUF58 domain-containing protein n=1 Tax=Paenibacillus alba TaxID=1197127 RepID=A0ABU6G8L8_9BACL|nr:DUF58 domain-containing protein [Paenibacillus alba]MEC0230538.1 DUF58 domain-containing protein [Paenibacillus alba]NQX65316.1 DUF58 domain-containing protein [Paenibacillus alba]
MNRPVFTRFGVRPRFPAALWLLISCFTASLLFMLFQGGKLASMLFIIVTLLSIYLLSGNWSGVRRAQGVRKLTNIGQEAHLEAGQSLQIGIGVQIPGFWPIPYIMIKDQLVRLNGEETIFEGSLVPDWKRRGELLYSTPPLRRGYYRFGRTECLTEDIFGFFQHKGRLELEQPITVYPQTVTIREWAQFHQMLKGMQHHSTTTRAHRETTQINGVREYIYGDRLSRIHWNATAKTGTWKSKEFERESLPKTIILLDRTARAYGDVAEFELAVSIAASLFRYGASRDLALGLLSNGKESTFIEAKQSQNHHKMILKHLVGVEADGYRPLNQILKEHARDLPAGCFFVLISPQKGSVMMQVLTHLDHLQMNPCHIWVHGKPSLSLKPQHTEKDKQEDWIKAIRSQGYMGYEVSQLTDLPNLLGGAKRYA